MAFTLLYIYQYILQVTVTINDSVVDVLSDSILQLLPPEVRSQIQRTTVTENTTSFRDLILPFLIMAVMIYLGYKGQTAAEKRQAALDNRYYQNQAAQTFPDNNYFLYNGDELPIGIDEIQSILLKRFPYYRQLNTALQSRFATRTQHFMQAKAFIIRSNDVFKEMPVLISAAAVQLSFGLDKFLLPHYKYIQVYNQEYFADGEGFRVLAGHVKDETITIAWNHFYNGYLVPDNGVNVGLHEMAHALYFQHIVARKVYESPVFKKQFAQLEATCSVYHASRSCRYGLYKDNAYINLQEFWADSVELFFEKPVELKQCYPEVYKGISSLLQQDPVYTSNPLHLQELFA